MIVLVYAFLDVDEISFGYLQYKRLNSGNVMSTIGIECPVLKVILQSYLESKSLPVRGTHV